MEVEVVNELKTMEVKATDLSEIQGVDWMDQIFALLGLERQLFVETLNDKPIKVFWRKNFKTHHGAGSWKLDNKVFYDAPVLLLGADGKQGEKVQYLKEVFEERNDSSGYYVMKMDFNLDQRKYVDAQRISMFDFVLSLTNLLQTRPDRENEEETRPCWF